METIIRDMRAVRRIKMQWEAAQTTSQRWSAEQNAERIRRRIPEPYRSLVGPDRTISEVEEAIADLANTDEEQERNRDPRRDISATEEPHMEDFDPGEYTVRDFELADYAGIAGFVLLLILMFRR